MRFYKRTACAVLAVIAITAAGAAIDYAAERGKGEKPEQSTQAPETPTASITRVTTPSTSSAPSTPEPEEEHARIYENIPLDAELQEFTFRRCEEKGLDYETVLAIMERESRFDPTAISATDDYGIMQINQCNHAWLKKELGITDFLDAKQSITAGTEILGRLAAKYDDPQKILMAYNMGETGAGRLWKEGTTTSAYSRDIMARRAAILKGGAQ